MKIEIWSDVMCPFCYIGKRHLEQALTELPFKDSIEINWKSYQLNPDYKNEDGESLYDYLSRSKGISLEQAKQMTTQVSEMANNVGLDIDFENNIPANSFNAHRLIHFAASKGKEDDAEETLFKAHFTENKDIDNLEVLLDIALELGLDRSEVKAALESNAFEEEVRFDIYESQQLGVRGVPFFVMDRKYALSGAQPVEAFKQAITQGYNEWKVAQENSSLKSLNTNSDNTCDENGCEV
ncbi:DsbA family oxidoreductase [Pedobacter xixiisoli]|uniref:Predicted dithiol-disulfide isomerase, DsbA family n=1 Tax=Pedobacter xixiisoli TaxID=1476464 RepID=A0A286ADF6_9SPHI|nr:DsbA family oxidoreductase [Pedobacter xixiisoli]SOD19934.1 Predicted dithiol-disulfide isomerase, DsbA family [Pedobacter xixiisoli]